VPLFFTTPTWKWAARCPRPASKAARSYLNSPTAATARTECSRSWRCSCAAQLPQLILGVGSIMDAGTAALYLSNGANFVVAPALDVETAKSATAGRYPYFPGCGSVTEITQAHELGCEIIKIFPGDSVGGPAFVKSVRGPCPWAALMPSGGVECTEENLAAWFGAGAACVSIGSALLTKELLNKKDYDGIGAKWSRRLR